ncbi:peptidoglycan DD-metalloendopeptidase family protein [Pseudomonas sp.]|uniref:peptidoglycan DD-metalloendopeptidase family protein n=1 Tax=Pseudomonas sp. TaxID=306 RepID=UPI001A10A13E|nr:peptidoglycan DD-metalloendopeptidase family protein [Pseudomonas sp.]MBF0675223.1 peptidoglycan DD-metalloendopeptidase family protein [Pseudomonas sp.]
MKPTILRTPLYPKSHLLAASGVAALLSLALLVFPSREVEAKKTYLTQELELGSAAYLEKDTLANPAPELTAADTAPFSHDAEAIDQASDTPTDPLLRQVTVGSGDTLSTLFSGLGLSANTLHEMLNSSKEAKQFSRIRAGQQIDFRLTPDGQLESMSSPLNSLETIRLSRTDQGYQFERERLEPETRQAYAHATINSSLFGAAQQVGLSHTVIMDLANVFGYDIDFAMDIREGDEFDVLYEEKVLDGKPVGTGNILAARFVNRGTTYTAVRYTDTKGQTSYYTADGTNVRKAFIRTPVDFARISSRFSTGRKHPILNKIRAHKGVDYAAPRGTPIKAAGDGKVILAGNKGGYGKTVIIQHGSRYRTLYAHMQGFAKNVRNGSTVKQGQIIGYIGTTGLSTGPHLHYEFQVNGTHVDPLSQKQLMADPLTGKEKKRFLQMSQPLVAHLNQQRTTVLAENKQ